MHVAHQPQLRRTGRISLDTSNTEYMCAESGAPGSFPLERDDGASSAQLVYKSPGGLFSRAWGWGRGGEASMFNSDPINR